MKEILKKNYDIEIDNYQQYQDGILFFLKDSYFYFVKCIFDEEYLNNINVFCNSLNKEIKVHNLVYNKFGKILTDGYVLMKINVFIDVITKEDLRKFLNINCQKYKNKYVSMNQIWEFKIDYLEEQLSELSDNKLINNSFDYFVGIAENLIKFYKENINIENIELCLSHNALNSLSTIDFYNPLKFSFDYYLKDVATYIKISSDYNFLYEILEKNLDYGNRVYLYVRLIFPFEYFEEVSKILLDVNNNYNLIKIINEIDKYENFIMNIQKIFGIYLFSWIKKE